jgi:hypothetical protein
MTYTEKELRAEIDRLERDNADLRRHNQELRETVKALLAPTSATRKPDFESPMRW